MIRLIILDDLAFCRTGFLCFPPLLVSLLPSWQRLRTRSVQRYPHHLSQTVPVHLVSEIYQHPQTPYLVRTWERNNQKVNQQHRTLYVQYSNSLPVGCCSLVHIPTQWISGLLSRDNVKTTSSSPLNLGSNACTRYIYVYA